MDTKIFIPDKIRVGYQERSDTYTKRLAYVIYYDEKGKVRKENSWESWRDKKLEVNDYTNEALSGFVLNKKVGDYSGDWGNHRKAYCRVYDPRGFEFEITIENLLYILENTSSIVGKGLEGEFVYGWWGSDLVLIPVSSPDYKKFSAFTELRTKQESILGKDLVPGYTYRTKQDELLIYLGRFDEYEMKYYYYRPEKSEVKNKGKRYWFGSGESHFETISSLSSRIAKLETTEIPDNFPTLMDNVQHCSKFSPLDPSKSVWIPVTKEELEEKANSYCSYYDNNYIKLPNGVYSRVRLSRCGDNTVRMYIDNGERYAPYIIGTVEELMGNREFVKEQKFLENGKEYKYA